jgi:hypothetical protein
MSGRMVHELLEKGKRLYAALEQETLDCIKIMGTYHDDEIERFVAKRQEILTSVQKFDIEYVLQLSQALPESEHLQPALEDFRKRKCIWVRRIIDADRLLLALAEMEKGKLRSELTAIAMGRRALCGYGTKEHRSQFSLDDTA